VSNSGAAIPPIGYLDRWTARPGEHLELKVSSGLNFDVDIVRVLQGDESPLGPGRREHLERWWLRRRFPAAVQEVAQGSCVLTEPLPALRSAGWFRVEVVFSPSRLDGTKVVAALLTADGRSSLELALVDNGTCELRVGLDPQRRRLCIQSAEPVRAGRWYRAEFGVDLSARRVHIRVRSLDRAPSGPQVLIAEEMLGSDEAAALRGPARPDRLMLGAGGFHNSGGSVGSERRVGHFDGKLEAPRITGGVGGVDGVGTFASGESDGRDDAFSYAWRFGPEVRGSLIPETGGTDAGARLINAPMPAVTGHAYDGSVICPAEAPELYRALSFHRDDLEDVGWETTATLDLPSTLPSGVYAARLSSEAGSRSVPFFVVPPRSAERPPIAVLLPTFTYLAYANEHVRESLAHFGDVRQYPSPQDLEISAHREFGLSLYDHHDDGTGVCFSSCRRPVLNLDPGYRFWLFDGPVHLGEDLYLLDWLDRRGFAYDVLTDHLLHEEGRRCLEGYRVVLTGSHPEYASSALIAALEEHVEEGGRLMYLGGNGFYWVTSVDPARPHLIEVRRGHAGGRAWESAAGETHHATTGEPGGLWRHRGRPPNRLLGVGFAAQGADMSAPGYRRVTREPRWEFVFGGLSDETAFGQDGLLLGGAAGNEVDRADPSRGTPAETVVLATSTGHSDAYQLALEDLAFTAPDQGGTRQPLVRSDLAITPYATGGAVFSVGAITWLGALASTGYDNDVARLTENVLRRFLVSDPL
jgi:N,N-dimethylformamidase